MDSASDVGTPAADEPGNLFANLPAQTSIETVETLAQVVGGRVERIVSTGQASPPGFWYDQSEHEWAIVLQGEAVVTCEGGEPQRLAAGDWIWLPAHRKHRVDWTSSDEPTIWLAVFFTEPEPSATLVQGES
ncbi:MAG: cupin domain-containing protein [Planctomycetales bacterium]|nr:cupin domain-containing protein [Planctomycetales bacterium]